MGCLDEDSVLAFVEGSLDEAARASAERHIDECASCADLVAASAGGAPEAFARRSLGEALAQPEVLAPGALIGRYVVVRWVGRGGMGDVYAAYDPRLDRRIALKLLRETSGQGAAASAAQERLLREAQAAGRLSHRNVVAVHDAGSIEDPARGVQVYLAMEFVEGETLASWLAARTPAPGWREIRDLFLAAGEGLRAAHEAGLVHRDFKPQNVMVGRDRIVRVMDFGLASDAARVGGGEKVVADLPPGTPISADTVALTKAGVLLGTPLYMAPEQFQARATDARTDQFAFCVALYEALYGERPFPSTSWAELSSAVIAGHVREPAQKGRVPAFLRRILGRGLKADPAERYPSMRELLSALRADPIRRRRTLALGGAVALAGIAAVFGVQRAATRAQRMCTGATERLAGIWETDPGGAHRNAIHRAFVATGGAIADETWTRVSALLDDYARAWSSAYTDTCEATHVRGEQSADVLDLRMSCLDGSRVALRALTDVLSKADARTVIEGVNAAHALPPLDRCADVPTLRAAIPPPKDAATRAQVAGLEARLADVKALTDTGKWQEAQGKAVNLVDDARAVAYRPLLAETLATQAWLISEFGDWNGAMKSYEPVIWVALAAHRDDIAAMAAAQLMFFSMVIDGLSDETTQWESLATALVTRLGPGHDRSSAWFHNNRGIALLRRGDFKNAAEELELALTLKRRALPPSHPDIGITLYAIAAVRTQLGEGEAALLAAQEAVDIYRTAYGDQSPLLGAPLENRAVAFQTLHRYAEAEHDLRVALADLEPRVGPDHLWTATTLSDLGRTLESEGKFREATPLLERALKIRERVDPTSPDLAETRFALARARWVGRDRAGARALAIAARDAYRALPGYAKWTAEIDSWLVDTATGSGRSK